MSKPKIRRALISVYDKTGIVDFVRALVEEFGIEIISTGGTAALLKENDIPVTLVEEITGFPEMLDGRVKTLHPKIHAAILADRDNPDHMRQLKEQGIEPIDMVVVNLYPFEKTVADPNCTFEQAIEMIDIGGPCLLRAAAKNYKHVALVLQTASYETVLWKLRNYGDECHRRDLHETGAWDAFCSTAHYDSKVAMWIGRNEYDGLPDVRFLELWSWGKLRYGENPHQHGEITGWHGRSSTESDLLCSNLESDSETNLSFNNYADGNAALELCKELTRDLCGTGLQPVKKKPDQGFRPLEGDRFTRRNLPHIQAPGRTYFVTFRLRKPSALSDQERDIVLGACRHWDREKLDLHAVVVMPDHVHLLLTPLEQGPERWVTLGEIVHSIKRHTARKINELRGRGGPLWQDEYFDRIIRNEKEYEETWAYIANNPIRNNLARADEYRWFWDDSRREELPENHWTNTNQAHRLQTGATRTSAARACVFIKHTNACGVGVADESIEAYRRAYLGDPGAAMGGILACNFGINANFAQTVMESYDRFGRQAGAGGFFVEVWIAPAFDDDAMEVIRTTRKWGKRVRLLTVGDMSGEPDQNTLEYKSITGGMLVQSRDLVGLNEDPWKVVTRRPPSDAEMDDLRLAWLVCKHTKSNAISICKDGRLIGNGAGQMSRVMSCRIATWLAEENGHAEELKGSVAASDAFFPFADGPGILIDAGVTAIIQPGGSKRDEETIAACDARGAAMILTGTRHFKH